MKKTPRASSVRRPRTKKRKPKTKRQGPLLLPKITRPVLPEVYRRQRLFRWLDDARKHSIIWIAAPAGAGKTTLVANYVQARKLPCLWYQVDVGDRDLAGFFHHLGLAVQQMTPSRRLPMPKLTPEYLGGVETFARNFFREIALRLRGRYVLVFDNLQDAGEQTSLDGILSIGLSELPTRIRTILISRSEPSETFVRPQLSGALAKLDWEELRLQEDESNALVRFLRPGRESAVNEQAAHLHRQCEGWVAGLILLLYGAAEGTGARPPDSTNAQSLFDYFIAEAFARRPVAVQEFLMQTALFSNFTAEMAEQLTGNAGARKLLNDLVRQHHFTERRTEAHGSYQYHPLFRAFLREQAGESWGEAKFARQLERAAETLEQAGDPEQALALHLDAGSVSAATRLILTQAPTFTESGRFGTLATAIAKLPATAIEREPWLLYWRGICGLTSPVVARRDLEQAYAGFSGREDATGLYLALAAIINSYFIEWADFRPASKWIDVFESLQVRYPRFPSMMVEAQVVFAVVTLFVHCRFGDPRTIKWALRAEELMRHRANAGQLGASGYCLGTYYHYMGEPHHLEEIAQYLRSTINAQLDPCVAVVLHIAVAYYEWSYRDVATARESLAEAMRIMDRSGSTLWKAQALGNYVYTYLADGDITSAAKYLEPMKALLLGLGPFHAAFYHHLAAMAAFHCGDLDTAAGHATTAVRAVRESGVQFAEGDCLLVEANIAFSRSDGDAAAQSLAAMQTIAAQSGSRWFRYCCRLTQARFALEEGGEAAREFLRDAMLLSRATGGHALPWFPHAILAPLFAAALEHGIEPEHVRGLIRRFNIAATDDVAHIETWPWRMRVYTFGGFSILLNDKPLTFSVKSQRKPLELLKALIAFGGREVREDKLTQALWPDADGDSAMLSLNTTLHRLRRLLGEDAIKRQEGRLTLSSQHGWVDVWAMERQLTELEQACQRRETDRVAVLVERVFALYRGEFLANESDYPWVLSMRERLRARFLRQVESAARAFTDDHRHDRAIDCYRKAIEVDPLIEGFYRGLMQSYLAAGHQAEALATFARCQTTLRRQLDIAPSADIQALALKIKAS